MPSAEPYWRKCLSQTWFPLASGLSTIITGLYGVKRSDPFLTTFGVVSGIATVGGAMYSPPAIQMLCRVGACLNSLITSVVSAVAVIFSAIIVFISAMTNLVSAVLSNSPRTGAIISAAWARTMASWDIEQGRPSPNSPIIIPVTNFPPTTTIGASHPVANTSPRHEAYRATTTATDHTNGYTSQDIPSQSRQRGSPAIGAPGPLMTSTMPDDEDMGSLQDPAIHPSPSMHDIDAGLTRNIISQTAMGSRSQNSSTTDSKYTNHLKLRSTKSTKAQPKGPILVEESEVELNNYPQRERDKVRLKYASSAFGPQHNAVWTSTLSLNASRPATNPNPHYEAYQATTTATDYTNGYTSQDMPTQFQQYGSPTIRAPPMASTMPEDEDMNPFQGSDRTNHWESGVGAAGEGGGAGGGGGAKEGGSGGAGGGGARGGGGGGGGARGGGGGARGGGGGGGGEGGGIGGTGGSNYTQSHSGRAESTNSAQSESPYSPNSKSYKTDLVNYCIRLGIRPEYATNVFGPQHSATWNAIVYLNGMEYGRGEGCTRQAAEEAAAKQALDILTSPNNPIIIPPPTGGARGGGGSGARGGGSGARGGGSGARGGGSGARGGGGGGGGEGEGIGGTGGSNYTQSHSGRAESTNSAQSESPYSPNSKSYKTDLVYYCIRLGIRPEYATNVFGPQHSATWNAIVYLNGMEYGRGEGRTKYAAEEAAAIQALDILNRTG